MAARKPACQSLKVLFIGNSYTARNDLPGLIAHQATAAGCTWEHQLISAGGAALRRHWNAGTAQAMIAGGGFDVVVLQEQSTLPVKNPARMYQSIRLFDPVIKASGARTALYLTWARQVAPETQQAISAAYRGIAQELAATVIPVGEAWQAFLAKHAQPALFDADQSHPTLAGSYLAACVFFATLFERSPVGSSAVPAGLSAAEAKLLEAQAWATARPRSI